MTIYGFIKFKVTTMKMIHVSFAELCCNGTCSDRKLVYKVLSTLCNSCKVNDEKLNILVYLFFLKICFYVKPCVIEPRDRASYLFCFMNLKRFDWYVISLKKVLLYACMYLPSVMACVRYFFLYISFIFGQVMFLPWYSEKKMSPKMTPVQSKFIFPSPH